MVYSVISALFVFTGSDGPIEILKADDSVDISQDPGRNDALNIDIS